ncbi:hypothetical protein GJAV_G00224380 [Gymnothorax javanicus]|nr:hypothetical protein GJAV_G00224380 [Gymnothorax javanicus]
MRTWTWKCAFLLGIVFFTITAFLYGHYDLDFIHSGGHVILGRPKATEGRPPSLQEDEKRTTAPPLKDALRPCVLRENALQDPALGFNFSVPVLQWAGHFSPKQWERLQQIPTPYGWKGLPIDVVNSTLALLSDPRNGQLFDRDEHGGCVRCAVVGNGGILKGSRQGKAIDAHHFVFRVNGAITKGFEEDVGTRTSFYGFTANTLKNSLAAYWGAGFKTVPQGPGVHYIFIPANARDYLLMSSAIKGIPVPSDHDKGDVPSKYFGPETSADKFKILHPDFVRYIKDSFLKSPLLQKKYAHLYMPSTGALLLFTALHACDQVSAYGYITDNYKAFSDHYFDKVKKPLIFYVNHDMQMEGRVWERLHTQKVMSLYKRPLTQ